MPYAAAIAAAGSEPDWARHPLSLYPDSTIRSLAFLVAFSLLLAGLKNHFAGWMVMALSITIGLCCGRIARGMRGVKPDWRNRVLWFSSPDASRLILTAFAAVIMGLALVLSLSRSGITCFAIAIVLSGWFVHASAWESQPGG